MSKKAPSRTRERQARIMVVDDDGPARLQIRLTLENAGHEVIEATSGEEALASFSEHPPELILLDIVMPGIDGFETCRHLLSMPGGEQIPVVMITGLEDEATITRAFDAGATDYVGKPINMLVLSYRVQYWLRSGSILNDLERNRRRVFKAQEIGRLGHWELDLETGRFHLSAQDPAQFGVSDPNCYESMFAQIVPGERHPVQCIVEEARCEARCFSLHYRIKLANGQERILLNQGEVIRDREDRPQTIMAIIQDITELKRAEDRIRHLAFYDNLTGLANPTLLRAHWSKIQPQATRSGKKIAIFSIDLDHFKRINDTHGHPVGDKVLIAVADRLKNILRQSDVNSRAQNDHPSSIISRLGGDEFTVLSADFSTLAHIANLAERITQIIEQPIILEERTIALSASIGISVFPDDSDDLDILLKNADTAMHEAKEQGRNAFKFFQPQFCNHNKQITDVEALIRWHEPGCPRCTSSWDSPNGS